MVFNETYELIGAGAVLPEILGGVKKILTWRFVSLDGARHFIYMLEQVEVVWQMLHSVLILILLK